MKNLIKPAMIVLGVTIASATFAQTSPDSTNRNRQGKSYNEQTSPDSSVNRNNRDLNRSDSTRMNDRRRNPSTMPADSTRTRPNDRMMQRDSLK